MYLMPPSNITVNSICFQCFLLILLLTRFKLKEWRRGRVVIFILLFFRRESSGLVKNTATCHRTGALII
jgi:hypothetical protein